MTVSTHIAEILRQGVWASLTGGWYYEPSHSIFCNTIHLYLWLLLFILPLIVGIVLNGKESFTAVFVYTSFIFALFTILKVLVTYLHVIFDTTEPVITNKQTDEGSKEVIELAEMNTNRNTDQPGCSTQASEVTSQRPTYRRPYTRVQENDYTFFDERPPIREETVKPSGSVPKVVFKTEKARSVVDTSSSKNRATDLRRRFSEPILNSTSSSHVRRMSDGNLGASECSASVSKVYSSQDKTKTDTEKKDEGNEADVELSEVSETFLRFTETKDSNDCSDKPSTSKDCMKSMIQRPGTPINLVCHVDQQMDCLTDRPSTSSAAWLPVRVSLNEGEKSDGALVKSEDEHDPSFLQSELTQMLFHLVEPPGSGIGAIQTDQLSKLARMFPRQQQFRNQNRSRSASSAVSALAELACRSGTHVASGHEDTSQGAVHSFQDAEGNWWTYTFDEHGVGTAHALGSSSTVWETIQKERLTEAASTVRPRLDVLHESTYASSEEDEDNHPSTSLTKVQTTRRERALSSSSNESYTYIPSLPASVILPTRTGAPRRQVVSFVNVASRFRSAVRVPEERRLGDLDQIMELLDGRRSDSDSRDSTSFNYDQRRSVSGPLHTRMLEMQERIFCLDMISAFEENETRKQPGKKSYYQMKMFPISNKCIKVNLDRLAVAALFDRNRSVVSCVCDVLLASMVSVLASLVLNSGIYYDLSLFFFAFGVAGAHFSLLKSVQPDAASPIHGFNWLVAYSRPIYFSILCIILLTVNAYVAEDFEDTVAWNWNPYRLFDGTDASILLGVRDLVSSCLLLLPIACTLGWLPQVSTLVHHVLEQIEMHFFGGTASFGVLSTLIQIFKSVFCWFFLVGIIMLAKETNPNTTQNPGFSTFLALAVGFSYILSRFSSNIELSVVIFKSFWKAVCNLAKRVCGYNNNESDTETTEDEARSLGVHIPHEIFDSVTVRARHDLLFAIFISCAVFALHSSSVFTVTRPYFFHTIAIICSLTSILNHYVYPQLRTHTPWKLVAKPILKSSEFSLFECVNEARLMSFERVYVWLQALERNILYPLLIVCLMCDCAWSLPLGAYLTPLICLRLLRGGFSHPQLLYVPLILSLIITRYDWASHVPIIFEKLSPSALFAVTFYISVILYPKWLELYLKINFIMAYVAPWQISWGSAFHAFAQPFSVPHSALLWIQTIVSSIVSAPLNPFLGSSFFLSSYVRPVKFWERDYNTKRSDASNIRLSAQIDRGPMLDDSNLNAVFYEHLTRSLQKSLAGDLAMGRWATSVHPGDCFILAGFYLNCLVHIVEVGNGFITFQLRGLEFRGTYCHQREVEAITEDQTEGTGFCCCSPGSLPGFLSLNTAWGLRWLAWEVVAAKYVVDGYSITDNSAVNLLQVHELRRLLVSLYVKCIIFHAISSEKLSEWLKNETVRKTVETVVKTKFIDVDNMFGAVNDEDYDCHEGGISKASFMEWYSEWMKYCLSRKTTSEEEETPPFEEVVALCYILSLVGRRTLGTAAHNRHSTAAESFLYGLHALFKGDFRIQSQDEWVFADMDLLRLVISPAVKMALKLHQDHFAAIDDLDNNESLFDRISEHQASLFISHEQDPAWRRAILSNTPSLLALRHMYDDGQDDYKIIMLNKMHQNMRVIKLNRECVRAFWAGQQQELIFLRNRNPERGSIQNARQVLRNMINSSADQPVGYPIYVSPLTTSFVDSHPQINKIVGPPITVEEIGKFIHRRWTSLRSHLGPSTSSFHQGGCPPPAAAPQPSAREPDDRTSQLSTHMQPENSVVHMLSDGSARVAIARRPHCETPIALKKTSISDPAGSSTSKRQSTENPPAQDEGSSSESRDLNTQEDEEGNPLWGEITDIEHIFKYLTEPLKSTGHPLVEWPSEEMRQMACHKQWYCPPVPGTTGRIVYRWYPNHPNKKMRSHIGAVIYLICVPAMANALVAVGEGGCNVFTESAKTQTDECVQTTPME
ncbi:unnamed protein product [Auanema sp. JU1783]|nr:unnamed protein product [Auanema sp. JU1783]